MKRTRILGIAMAVTFSAPSWATIRENYPNLDMAFVGNHVVEGPAGTIVPHPFALRLTDPAGNPLRGVTVYFQPDYQYNLNPDLAPPLSAYGDFGGVRELAVVTDENGVARTPNFRIGQIGHSVLASIPGTTTQNIAATQGGWGYALFHVNTPHQGPADPQAPIGIEGASPLPTDSFMERLALACALILAAVAALRRARIDRSFTPPLMRNHERQG